MDRFPEKLLAKPAEREGKIALRKLPSPNGLVNFASNDYLAALDGIEVQQKLRENIEFFKQELLNLNLEQIFIPSKSAIQCCKKQGNEKVKKIAKTLQEKGFDVRPILSPTVPNGEERLRFCLHAENSKK